MRVIISAGGTGGHIYPALSILNKIKEEEPDSEFLYIGTTDRMESKLVPELNIPYIGLEMLGLKKNLSCFKALYLFIKALKKCRKEIKKFNPDVVIGAGGYVTAPVIYSAHKLGYKTYIHEQNSIPGKSNKFLYKRVNKVFASLPNSMEYFPQDKVILTGNPRSSEALSAKSVPLKEFGLDDNKKLVLIVMGSLGSMTINNCLMDIIPNFKDKDYQVLIVTGNNYYDKFKDIKLPRNVHIVPFITNMINLLSNVSLIVSRAGASTIAEITALGIPSILVPSPYVANNHQYYNAKELVDNKASIMLEEKDFNKENLLKNIDLLLNDSVLYKSMHENASLLAIRDSLDIIYKEIKK